MSLCCNQHYYIYFHSCMVYFSYFMVLLLIYYILYITSYKTQATHILLQSLYKLYTSEYTKRVNCNFFQFHFSFKSILLNHKNNNINYYYFVLVILVVIWKMFYYIFFPTKIYVYEHQKYK